MVKTVHDLNQLPLFYPTTDWAPPDAFPSFAGAKRIAIDVETRDENLSELGPGVRRGGYVVGIAVGIDDHFRGYYPIRHEAGGNLPPETALGWLRDEAKRFSGEVVGARLIYDLDYLAHEDVLFKQVKAYRDVQVAEPLLNEWRYTYALDALARDYLGEGKDQGALLEAAAALGAKTAKAAKNVIWRLPPANVGAYAEADVDRPLRTLPLQEKLLAEADLLEVWDLETDQIPILLAMRRRGVRIDGGRAERVARNLKTQRDELVARVRRSAPKAELWAPASFAGALREAGLDVPTTPKTREPSITREWLDDHAEVPLVADLRDARRLDRMIGTFLEGHLLRHAVDGRVYAEFNQLKGEDKGTIARYSSTNPNLQQIPARDEVLAPLIRSCFVPEEGEVWEQLDFSQIEYRLLVEYARGRGADAARKAYRDDPLTDFHQLVGTFIKADATDKYVRKKIKNTNFCKVYGGGYRKLASTAAISVEEARAFYETYDRELPFVKTTYDACDRRAKKRGWIRTLSGRLQRFPFYEGLDGRPTRESGHGLKRYRTYVALNRLLQGGAADVFKYSLRALKRSGVLDVLGAPLLLVHDEIDLSRPKTKEGEEAVVEAKRVMETCVNLRVPIVVERESGPSWGRVSKE